VADELATGKVVRLPAGAAPPFHVYVNGEEQIEGRDFAIEAAALRFTRPLAARRRPEGAFRKLVMSTAGIGFYSKADTVDVHYTDAEGRPGVASGLEVEPGS
jgi:hypothetical protein